MILIGNCFSAVNLLYIDYAVFLRRMRTSSY